MALERNNTAPEFESMLRRHLQQGGAPVAPCHGFDADTASAYLERALSPLALTRFETHLAGCAACRHHVVALARLVGAFTEAPAAPLAAPAGVTESLWTRWQTAVVGWFDLSQWKLGWATAATAGGVLLAVLGVRAWQQTRAFDAQANLTVAEKLNTQAPASLALTETQTTTGALSIAPGMQATGDVNAEPAAAAATELAGLKPAPAAAADKAERTNQVPRPVVLPNTSLVAGPVAQLNRPEIKVLPPVATEPDFGTRPVVPAARTVGRSVGPFNLATSSLAQPVSLNQNTPLRAAPFTTLPGEPEKKELVTELVLPPPRRAGRAEQEQESPSTLRERDLRTVLKHRASSFMPFNAPEKDDARVKEANVKEAREQTQPLMKRLNGHVFYFEHGFWIDEEYNSEAKLPLKRLVRGSQAYQQAQIENPSLEQFFQLGQVIVVWKGVVYEVRK